MNTMRPGAPDVDGANPSPNPGPNPGLRPSAGPSPAARSVGVLGWVLLLASLAVMVAAAVHTAGLGPDPTFRWDCDDVGQCDDVWVDARWRCRWLTVGGLLGVGLAWAAIGWGRPLRWNRRPTAAGGPWLEGVLVVDVITLLASVPAVWVSLNLWALVLTAGTVLSGVIAWDAARRVDGRDRDAWFRVGGIWAMGLLGSMVVATALGMTLVLLPAAVLVLLAPLVLHACALGPLPRTPPRDGTEAGVDPSGEPRTGQPPLSWAIVAPGAAAILLLALWAAWPVPSKDGVPPVDGSTAPRSIGEAPESEVPRGWDEPVESVAPYAELSTDARRDLLRLEASGPRPEDVCAPESTTATLAFDDAALGHRYGTITLVNHADVACTLHGHPGLGARGAWGHRFTPPIEHVGFTDGYRYAPQGEAPDPVMLAPGSSAVVLIEWTGSLGGAESEPLGDLVLQTAPGEDPLRVADPAGEASDIGQSTTLRVGPFRPAHGRDPSLGPRSVTRPARPGARRSRSVQWRR